MKVHVQGLGTMDIPQDSLVSDLVASMDKHLDSVIVIMESKPVPLDTPLKEGDTLRVLSVVSGG